MHLGDVMSTMADRLGTIDQLNIYAFPAENVSAPAAVIGFPEDYEYDQTYGRGSDRMTLPVFLVVGKADAQASLASLGAYVDGSGERSVKATLEGSTYSSFDSLRVQSVEFEHIVVAGVEYLTGVFSVDIFGDGST